MATGQIRDARDAMRSSNTRFMDPGDAANAFGEAAFLYLKRFFHHFFLRTIAGMNVEEMAIVSQGAIAFIGGRAAIVGELTVGQALALLTLMRTLASVLNQLATLM